MNQMTVGQFKANFSEVLAKVVQGKIVGVTYGKNKKKVAALVPYSKLIKNYKFKPGLLSDKASFKIMSDFKMNDKGLLGS